MEKTIAGIEVHCLNAKCVFNDETFCGRHEMGRPAVIGEDGICVHMQIREDDDGRSGNTGTTFDTSRN